MPIGPYCVSPDSPLGACYLRLLYDEFGFPGLFAAYNAGPGRYQAWLAGGRPLPAETVAYFMKMRQMCSVKTKAAARQYARPGRTATGNAADFWAVRDCATVTSSSLRHATDPAAAGLGSGTALAPNGGLDISAGESSTVKSPDYGMTSISQSQNAPDRHHYVPEFLLRQWGSKAIKLWCYYRNERNAMWCRPSAPGGMGYEHGLYTTDGLPDEHKQQVETRFMMPLDTAASEAHALMLADKVAVLTVEQRSRWANLIMSLRVRSPTAVAGIRAATEAVIARAETEATLGLRDPVDLPAAAKAQMAMRALMGLSDDDDDGRALLKLSWGIIEVGRGREFFISDSPLGPPRGAGQLLGSCIMMPVAPRKLFVAAPTAAMIAGFRRMPDHDLVRLQNGATVGQAREFVGATNRIADKFIRAHFGTLLKPLAADGVADRVRAERDALVGD